MKLVIESGLVRGYWVVDSNDVSTEKHFRYTKWFATKQEAKAHRATGGTK
jgi:hypothetical protein